MEARCKYLIVVIEHLEDHLSRWLVAEYKHALRLCKSRGVRMAITNVKNENWMNILRFEVGVECYRESVTELEGVLYSSQERVVVLDPAASELLGPSEAHQLEAVVVGGILGDNPPRRRTAKLLSPKLPRALRRSLGPYQMSIDGATYVALKTLLDGIPPLKVPLKINPSITFQGPLGLKIEVILPFAYPLSDEGKIIMPPELPELLARGLAYEEYKESQER